MNDFLELNSLDIYQKEIEALENLYNHAGNCVMNGYIGSSIDDISYDEAGKVEFHSVYQKGDLVTVSTGAILENSIVIKQMQTEKKKNYYQMFSWNKEGDMYTYLAFDDQKALDHAYQQIKKQDLFLGEDTQYDLLQLGVPFDHVMDVRSCQKTGEDFLSSMIAEYESPLDDVENSKIII